MFYDLKNNLQKSDAMDDNFIAIIPFDKAAHYNIINQYIPQIPMLFTDFHFSKIETFCNFLYGYINIPEILLTPHSIIRFIYTKNYIIFIDKNEFISELFEKIIEASKGKITSSGSCLYYVLDFIMAKDLEKINSLQQNLIQLELSIFNDNMNTLIREITNYRSKTLNLHHYYVQVEGICGVLVDDTKDLFEDETKQLFCVLEKKVSLFCHESEQIWEYTSQIRDVYQQQLDVHQNLVMKFLTVVTTIFMPLTLITGWYGMNFETMPELHWRYGYPALFVVGIIIVIILCVIFKKKKWW